MTWLFVVLFPTGIAALVAVTKRRVPQSMRQGAILIALNTFLLVGLLIALNKSYLLPADERLLKFVSACIIGLVTNTVAYSVKYRPKN